MSSNDRRQLLFNGALLGITGTSLVLYSYAFLSHVAAGLRSDIWDEMVWVATLCATIFYYQAFSHSYTSYQRRRGMLLPIGVLPPSSSSSFFPGVSAVSNILLKLPVRPIPGISIGNWILNSPVLGSSPTVVHDNASHEQQGSMSEASGTGVFPGVRHQLGAECVTISNDDFDATPSLMVSPPTPSSTTMTGGAGYYDSPDLRTPDAPAYAHDSSCGAGGGYVDFPPSVPGSVIVMDTTTPAGHNDEKAQMRHMAMAMAMEEKEKVALPEKHKLMGLGMGDIGAGAGVGGRRTISNTVWMA